MTRNRSFRTLAAAALASLLGGSALVLTASPAAAAARPLDVSLETRCEGSDPVVTVIVQNRTSEHQRFDILENGVGVLGEREVASMGTQHEAVPYPETGIGTSYVLFESNSDAELGRAELTEPAPDCVEDPVPSADPEPTISYEVGCEGPVAVVQVTLENPSVDDSMPWLFFDLDVVQADVLIPALSETTVYMDYPETGAEHPFLELWTIDERLIASTELTEPDPGCDPTEGDGEETTPVDVDVTVVDARPAIPVAGTPAYTG